MNRTTGPSHPALPTELSLNCTARHGTTEDRCFNWANKVVQILEFSSNHFCIDLACEQGGRDGRGGEGKGKGKEKERVSKSDWPKAAHLRSLACFDSARRQFADSSIPRCLQSWNTLPSTQP